MVNIICMPFTGSLFYFGPHLRILTVTSKIQESQELWLLSLYNGIMAVAEAVLKSINIDDCGNNLTCRRVNKVW